MSAEAWGALYGRVSGDRQEKEATIETQVFKLRERMQAEGVPACEEYLDNPYTGTVANRPALDRLMADARAGRFTRLFIYHPDRLARGKPWLRPYLEDQLRRAGVSITYLTYVVEDTPEGRAMDAMMTAFAEYEREHSQQRLRDGKQAKIARNANWRAAPVFAYRYVPPPKGQKDGHFEVIEGLRPMVRAIFQHAIDGRSLRWITVWLIQQGVPTVKGGTWTPSGVRAILHNPLYAGRPTYGRYARVEPKRRENPYSRYSLKERPQEQWQHTTAPAIVTHEEQEAALAALSRNKILSRRNTKGEYLLSGIIFCATPHTETGEPCARRMRGVTDGPAAHPRVQYRCNRTYPEPDRMRMRKCRGHISAATVDTQVWGQLQALLRRPDVLTAQLDAAQSDTQEAQEAARRTVQRAAATLDDVERALSRLLDMHLAGTVDEALYAAKQAELVEQRERCRASLAEAQDMLDRGDAATARWAGVRAYCAAVADQLDELSFEQRRALVVQLVKRVIVYPDHVEIEGVLPSLPPAAPGDAAPSDLGTQHCDAMIAPCAPRCAERPPAPVAGTSSCGRPLPPDTLGINAPAFDKERAPTRRPPRRRGMSSASDYTYEVLRRIIRDQRTYYGCRAPARPRATAFRAGALPLIRCVRRARRGRLPLYL
jgi:site-specific DNA recombinase